MQMVHKELSVLTITCHWIKPSQVPRGKQVTYACTVVAIRTEKAEQKRVRITVGGDRLDYPGETSTDTASLDTTKLLINSVLSTPGARMGAIDISNFYIHNDLKEYQYMRFHISIVKGILVICAHCVNHALCDTNVSHHT
jgi:hypothetical protein